MLQTYVKYYLILYFIYYNFLFYINFRYTNHEMLILRLNHLIIMSEFLGKKRESSIEEKEADNKQGTVRQIKIIINCIVNYISYITYSIPNTLKI